MATKEATQAKREQIYLMNRPAQTIPDIAQTLGISPASVRKWWRRGDWDDRFAGTPPGPSDPRGALKASAEVQRASLKLKREHKRWGANRVLIELHDDPLLTGLAFPSRSRL